MKTIGERKFIEISGERTHELPPLLVQSAHQFRDMRKVVEMAETIVEGEDMIADLPPAPGADLNLDTERRRMDLAINLVEQYLGFVDHWQWGDSIVEWIRQCEITFDTRMELRNLMRSDLWPHAGRSSFVTLLADKSVHSSGVTLEEAVGLRLTFRQPPPIGCFSDQFLLLLNSSVARTAYSTWASMNPAPISSFPPERFKFEVVKM
jgi:hypothetical protein